MTLPASEIERIEANAKFYIYTLLATNGDVPWDQTKDAYVSGAQAEAVRGREMMVAFAEWITENADGYHGKVGIHWYLRLQEDDTKHTTDELLDIYLSERAKK